MLRKSFSLLGYVFVLLLPALIVYETVVLIISPKTNLDPRSDAKSRSMQPIPPQRLITQIPPPHGSIANWVSSITGQVINLNHFGAYVMIPHQNTLFIGYSLAHPAEQNGALITQFENNQISAIYPPLSEQGVHDMEISGTNLFIPGVDPSEPGNPPCENEWRYGNFYKINLNQTPRVVTKYRQSSGLNYLAHMWGVDSSTTELLAATSTWNDPSSNQTPCSLSVGYLFKSNNQGQTWTRINPPVNNNRVYDVIRFNQRLYAISGTLTQTILTYSNDNGQTWTPVSNVNIASYNQRLFIFNGELYGAVNSSKLFKVNQNNQFASFNLAQSNPSAIMPTMSYDSPFFNSITHDDTYIYIMTKDKRVARSVDLVSWETVSYIPSTTDLISIVYWPNRNAIVVSSKSQQGDIWLIPLSTQPSPTPSPSPSPSLSPPPPTPSPTPSCQLAQPQLQATPSTATANAQTEIRFTVRVTNQNSTVCPPEKFDFSLTPPNSNWKSATSPYNINLSSGQSADITVFLVAPVNSRGIFNTTFKAKPQNLNYQNQTFLPTNILAPPAPDLDSSL